MKCILDLDSNLGKTKILINVVIDKIISMIDDIKEQVPTISFCNLEKM